MPTRRDQIIDTALRIIESEPTGIKCSELCQRVEEELPDFSPNYIRANIYLLDKFKPEIVDKPERGLFRRIVKKK